MATEVGSAAVTIIPSARGFAKALRQEIAKEFASSDLDKAISESLGNRQPLKLPVQAEVDVDSGEAIREARDAARDAERAAPPIRLKVDVDRGGAGAALLRSFGGALSSLASGASTVVGAASSMVSSVTGIVAALAGLAAAATFTVPAVYLLGGAIGSIPAIATGAVAAIASLAIGFRGIGEAFKETARGGGGAGVNLAAQARQVAQATRGVESAQRSLARAQRDVVEAQKAVTRAREAEVERLQDLNRSVKRARLDEEDAALRVRDALEDLDRAQRSGDVDEIERANLAYRQALLGLEDAKDATEDLTAEQAKATKVGVEGSDQVQAALQRQRDAIEGVTAAQAQLLSAQEALQAANEKQAAGGGGVAQDLIKLAPAAQKFVDTVKSLKPAFERLRLDVQQRLFAGLGGTVKRLATAWFPQLNKTLGSYADTFNRLAKRAGDSLSQKSFIDNMGAGAESARKALERIGHAVSGPLVDAFGRLSRAAGPFIEKLGDEIGELVEDFSAWIAKADESGKLEKFFERAGEIFGDLLGMGKDIGRIFGSVMEILFGKEETTTTPWEGLKISLDKLADWFEDPENRRKVQDWIDKVREASLALAETALTVSGWIDKVQGWIDKITGWKNALSTAWQEIKETAREKWDEIIAFFTGLPERAGQALSDLPSKVREKFVEMAGQAGYALGRAIGSWINLVASMPGRAAQALASLPSQIAGAWRRAIPAVNAAIGAMIRAAIFLVAELPGKAHNALRDIGSTLIRAGRELIGGLIRGIREEVPALDGMLSWITSKIPDWKGPYDKDKVLLLSAGRAIMTGLVTGISGEVPALRRQLGDVTDVISGTAVDLALASSVGDWGSRSGSATPAPVVPTLAFGGEAPDSFMRWVRENVRIYYGGSAQAALGS